LKSAKHTLKDEKILWIFLLGHFCMADMIGLFAQKYPDSNPMIAGK